MSDTGEVPQKAYDPNKNEPEKERIQIPAWWSIVALIMAGLVFLPIQYANMHSQKPGAPEEAGAKQAEKPGPAAAEASQPKQAAEKAEQAKTALEPVVEAKQPRKPEPAPAEAPQPKQAAEKAEQAKPAPELVVEAKQAEKPEPAAAEAPQPKQVVEKAEQAKPAPKQVSAAPVKAPLEKQKAEDATYYRIDGKDGKGRKAAFSFIILTNGYAWAKGSSSAVLVGGKAIPDANSLFAPKVLESLAGMSDVIAVGLATDEGKRAEEEARALARSKTFATWIKKVLKPGIPLWRLTLGQIEKACKAQADKDLNFEQPVLLIGVQSKAEGTILQEALADAITGRADFPSRECYSRFDMLKIR
jgi:outer membrane biosynthesis protein TonB